ncbi:MAG: hypothetical protein HRU21_11575 [Pseudomonadales bacterium]|nr:hypothetical protein [Pseudomonadales bacterium]
MSIKPYGSGGGGEETARWQRYGAYSIEHFIKDSDGNILVDKVLRLEDINHEFIPFLQALKLPVEQNAYIIHRNSREGEKNYREYYSKRSADYIADIYRYDIINYGYQF